jgi:hypothetical protein
MTHESKTFSKTLVFILRGEIGGVAAHKFSPALWVSPKKSGNFFSFFTVSTIFLGTIGKLNGPGSNGHMQLIYLTGMQRKICGEKARLCKE